MKLLCKQFGDALQKALLDVVGLLDSVLVVFAFGLETFRQGFVCFLLFLQFLFQMSLRVAPLLGQSFFFFFCGSLLLLFHGPVDADEVILFVVRPTKYTFNL